VVSVYDVQQPVQQSVSFSLEARIRYKRVIAGYERQRDIVGVGSLQVMSWLYRRLARSSIYPRVDDAWRLHQDDLLEELDAAYAHARGGCVHSAQDVRLDASHELPVVGIVGVGDTGHMQV
jgi:hypothetical protein